MIIPKHKELKVADIVGADYNPENRVVGQHIRELADSMSRIGLIYPIVVDEENVLIDGHRRVAAAMLLGWETIKAVVFPSSDRDQIYANVNATARRMVGKDALGVWLANSSAVSKKQSKVFEAMQESIGLALVKRVFKEGLSARVWNTACRISRYAGHQDIASITTWLLDHAIIGQVMKALEAKEDPRVFLSAIQKNRPIRFKLQVD